MPRYIATTSAAPVLDFEAETDGEAIARVADRDAVLCAAHDGVTMPIHVPMLVTVPVFNLLDTKLERDEDGVGTLHVWCSSDSGDDFELAMDMQTASVEVVAWSTLACEPGQVPSMVAMDPMALSNETLRDLRWWAVRDYGVQAQYEDARTEERRARAED